MLAAARAVVQGMAAPAETEGIENGGSEYHRAEELGIGLSARTNGRQCGEQVELEQIKPVDGRARTGGTTDPPRIDTRRHSPQSREPLRNRNRESRCCSSTGPRDQVVKQVSVQLPAQHTDSSSGSDDEYTLRVRPPTETIVELETEEEWKEKVEEMAGELYTMLFCRMRPAT